LKKGFKKGLANCSSQTGIKIRVVRSIQRRPEERQRTLKDQTPWVDLVSLWACFTWTPFYGREW